jgi:TRAP-type C4-dicarboxylate transport system substrate-binding protein
MKLTQRRFAAFSTVIVAAAVAFSGCGLGTSSGGDSVTLRLSHQWPAPSGDEGDFRALLAERFAKRVEDKTEGSVNVKLFPNGSLVGAKEQYAALQQGALEMSVFPLFYASGRDPIFNITMMPGLVRNHEEAKAWQKSEIGERVEQIAEEKGVKILTWVWNSGVFAVKGDPIVDPEDVRSGMVMRGAGASTEEVLEAAGAGISSLPSSEIYSAFQTGVLDGVTTSASSVVSFNLQEQIDSYTAPTRNSIWFGMQPLIISLDAWKKLSPQQQEQLEAVGQELQDFAYEASQEDDKTASDLLGAAGVRVAEMDDQAFARWQALSKKTAWNTFAKEVPEGQELLDLAQKVADSR